MRDRLCLSLCEVESSAYMCVCFCGVLVMLYMSAYLFVYILFVCGG